MKRREIKFNNARDAANWMLNHPLEHVYDEYNNYWLLGPYSNVIEYNYEIDIENLIWDMDRYSVEEFIERFDGLEMIAYEDIKL